MSERRLSDRNNKGVPPARYPFMPVIHSPGKSNAMSSENLLDIVAEQNVASDNISTADDPVDSQVENTAQTSRASGANPNQVNEQPFKSIVDNICKQFTSVLQIELKEVFKSALAEAISSSQTLNETRTHVTRQPVMSSNEIPRSLSVNENVLPSTSNQQLFPANAPEQQARVSPPAYEVFSAHSDRNNGENVAPNSFEYNTSTQRQMSPHLSCSTSYVKTVDLPKFDGDPINWPIFERSFIDTTAEFGYTNARNIIRLRQALTANARSTVEALLPFPESVPEIMATLKQNFGRPDQLVNRNIAVVRKMPVIQSGNYVAIVSFANTVKNLAGFMRYAQADHRLSDVTLVTELVGKLPPETQMQWAEFSENSPILSITNLSLFLSQLARRANIVQDSLGGITPAFASRSSGPANQCRQPNKKNAFVAKAEINTCHFCENACAMPSNCETFKNMTVKMRWEKVKERKLCFSCLKPGHGLSLCRKRSKCGEDGCVKYHNKYLHNAETDEATTKKVFNAEAHVSGNLVLFQIVPVIITVGGKSASTYAFVDHGSSHSMIESCLANKLGMEGERANLSMQWLGNMTSEQQSVKVCFQIQGTSSFCKPYRMTNTVYTVKSLNLPCQSSTVTGLVYNNAKPELIIGLDHAHLTTALSKPNMPGENKPIIIKTRLGMLVYGIDSAAHIEQRNSSHVFAALSVKRKLQDLEQSIKEYFLNDNMNICQQKTKLLSDEEAAAMQLARDTTKMVNGRYEVGLLWKNECPKFPPTREAALRRLKGVEVKMKNNQDFASQYTSKLSDYITKGYARELSARDAKLLSAKTFYLPHFAVCNPNKKSLRIVFDAAAVVDGASLNKALLAGPDLNQSLLCILFKFRQRPVAVCGDIKEMFLQVAVRKDDQDAQRFLWKKKPTDEEPTTYVMQRMLFGAACSPMLAQYVKNLNATINEHICLRAAAAIVNNHYVDDYVDCFENEDEAKEVVKGVISIHKKGGFELSNIKSNSKRVLRLFGTVQTTSSNLVALEKIERVLGMYWDYEQDCFCTIFRFHKVSQEVLSLQRAPTKREVLQLIMSVFDPYGLLGSLMIAGKLFMQELWKSSILWDEKVPDRLYPRWKSWLTYLKQAHNVQVPRCYHEKITSSSVQLHIFADASEQAMAAVAYFRIVTDENVTVKFVFAKTRCAPLKYMSIPRMELQAAVIAVRIKETIVSCHEINISQIVYWTDSTTVVAWIRSKSRCFKQFVANRVGEILDHSEVQQWRWLPGVLNVADEGTRGTCGIFHPDGRWLQGPKFLAKHEEEWPKQPRAYTDDHDGSELKNKTCAFKSSLCTNVIEFGRYSKLLKLIRVVAWLQLFVKNCRLTPPNRCHNLSWKSLNEAELLLCRNVQQNAFKDDYKQVLNGRELGRSSSLRQLNPFIDEYGVMRINGRLERATFLTAAEKRLIILPKRHVFTALVVKHYHEKLHHINRDTIIAEIRQKYWVPSIRSAVKSMESHCNECKIRKAKPKQPIMGLLPEDRITPYVRPFSYTGLDFFGPLLVTVKRGKEKRWVALFTCLTTRAVHLELAADLSTDACVVCLRNFMNRRGVPVQIRSDNGTNFQGIEKELKNTNDFLDNKLLAEKCAGLGIKWVFNIPANPSQGGAWERLVQSVKKALARILKEYAPRLETLISALIEAENIVNSRPLTHLPIDINEEEPLTPNHFLLNTANSTHTPASGDLNKLCSRKQWKIAQTLKNAFWKRWINEYLPDLTRRTKWCSSDGSNELTIGDLVYICDAALPRSEWRRGRILQLHYGRDNVTRSAEIQTAAGILKRPVAKLAKLDITAGGETPKSSHGGGDVKVDSS